MKRIIVSILAILTVLTLSIPVNCSVNSEDVDLGEVIYPTIDASSLEDFSKKLNNIKLTNDNVVYYDITLDEINERVIERIEAGKDYIYLPDIDFDITDIDMYVWSDISYAESSSSKYGIGIYSTSEIALETTCWFRYDNMGFRIGYDKTMSDIQRRRDSNPDLYNSYIDLFDLKTIYQYDLEIFYTRKYDSYTKIYFESCGESLEIVIDKVLTDEEIKALPRGLFYPKILTITDIKNGNFSGTDVSDELAVIVDEPKQSDDAESVDAD